MSTSGAPRLLLCATEAGSARNVAALAGAIEQRRAVASLVTSASSLHLFGSLSWCADVRTGVPDSDVPGLLDAVAPAAVICGTTTGASPDRLVVRAARERGVRSVVVIDERYGYAQRFAAERRPADLPDAIAVMDEGARAEAAAEGLPIDRCVATGSPALAQLADAVERFVAEPPARPDWLVGLPARPIVTFLSETFCVDYGAAPGEAGELGPYVGYTETTVFEAVREAVQRSGGGMLIVEKQHPSHRGALVRGIQRYDKDVSHVQVRAIDLWPLLWHSAAVIGMRSMALLEAYLLGAPAISYQPGLIGTDRCTAVRLGVVPSVTDDELVAWLSERRNARRSAPPAARQAFSRRDASTNVLDLALGAA